MQSTTLRALLRSTPRRGAPPAVDVTQHRPQDVRHAVGRARSVGYWLEVVCSGEYARFGVYALEAYGISR